MKNYLDKYASILLNTCLKIESNQPLFISYNSELSYFVDSIIKIAKKQNIKDIYLDSIDMQLKHNLLKEKTIEELKKHQLWNRDKWNEYAKKDAAFLMIASEEPGLMNDIDLDKFAIMNKYAMQTRKIFDEARDKSKLAWCIACAPTIRWAKEILPKSKNPLEELWNIIFDICLVKADNPEKLWQDKIDNNAIIASMLNNYQFKKLEYSSNNGTNFSIELPDNHIWQTGYEHLQNGKEVLVNFPTEEIFTSPNLHSANGIVYSTKPLNYNDVEINNFWIEFKNGKATSWEAKKGNNMLNVMINIVENSNYLGEVALVPNNSPISNSNIIFKETLFDENASCHLALGDSFPECIKNGLNLTKEKLFELGLNNCDSHIDFMIGSDDLNITGITKDNKRIPIFIDGNYSSYFKI